MLLADATTHVFDFRSFSFCDMELSICDMTDILVSVPNSAVVVHFWTVMCYVALISSKEASLMKMATSVESQSELGTSSPLQQLPCVLALPYLVAVMCGVNGVHYLIYHCL